MLVVSHRPGKHLLEIVKTANKLVGSIGRGFDFRFEKVVSVHSFVHTLNIAFPCGHCIIEKIYTNWRDFKEKLPRSFHDCDTRYEERLKELNVFNFWKRWLSGNFIGVIKMFLGFDSVTLSDCWVDDRERTIRCSGYINIGKKPCQHKNQSSSSILFMWSSQCRWAFSLRPVRLSQSVHSAGDVL